VPAPREEGPEPIGGPAAPQDRSLRLEIILAVGLGIAAIVTATASFQSALVEDQMVGGFNRGIRAVDEAGQAYGEAQRILGQDQGLFLEYAKAARQGDSDLTVYILTSLMSPNMRESVLWWQDDPDALTPFEEGSPYLLPALERWTSLKAEARDHFDAANEADETTDRYDFITVLAAVVLFFLGLASVVRHRSIRLTFAAMGSVVLALSIVLLVIVETA